MSNEPTFPSEAAVGDAEAGAAKPEATPPAPAPGQRKTFVKRGVAVGIGSAAIVAALLYANRGRRSDREDK
jgi:hypothetical protein